MNKEYRRKKLMTMINIHNGVLFQPNLINEGSKERQEDPLLFRPNGTSHTKLLKKLI